MKVVGLDQSLRSSGVVTINLERSPGALLDPALVQRQLIAPHPTLLGPARLCFIVDWFNSFLEVEHPDLVVMEDYAQVLSTASRQAVLGELGGVLRLLCYRRHQPLLVANPSHLKKFATGKGNAKKEIVLREAFKRWKVEWDDNNQVDAYVLARIGVGYLLDSTCETVQQREVVAKLKATGLLVSKRTAA